METIILNTDEMKQKVDEINTLKTFFDNNKERFLKYRYSDDILLFNKLGKIYKSFEDISENLGSLNTILKDYCDDIEYLEKKFSENRQISNKDLDSSLLRDK